MVQDAGFLGYVARAPGSNPRRAQTTRKLMDGWLGGGLTGGPKFADSFEFYRAVLRASHPSAFFVRSPQLSRFARGVGAFPRFARRLTVDPKRPAALVLFGENWNSLASAPIQSRRTRNPMSVFWTEGGAPFPRTVNKSTYLSPSGRQTRGRPRETKENAEKKVAKQKFRHTKEKSRVCV